MFVCFLFYYVLGFYKEDTDKYLSEFSSAMERDFENLHHFHLLFTLLAF